MATTGAATWPSGTTSGLIPARADAYAAEKRRVAAAASDRDEYSEGKAAFVQALEQRALAWRDATQE